MLTHVNSTALLIRQTINRHICQQKLYYLLPTSIVFKVEKATCIDTHHRLIVSNDVNAEWIQLQMKHMLTEAKSYLIF